MNKQPLVTIQILNWNRADETLRAIQSALDQTYENIEVIVIDNNSSDSSVIKINNKYPSVKVVRLEKNYGCPGGRNRGVKHCQGDYILFCDNDGVLHKDAVQNAVNAILEDENIAIVTGRVKEFDFESEIDTNYDLSRHKSSFVCLFQGGISLHNKNLFLKCGPYPDDYMYGQEETYLALRLLNDNFKIVKNESVVLWHKKSSTARNIQKEIMQAWGNTLSNAYQLFPLEYFILYFIYFWIVYPLYAIKHGFLISFIKSTKNYFKRLKNYDRKPVKRVTYRNFRNCLNNREKS